MGLKVKLRWQSKVCEAEGPPHYIQGTTSLNTTIFSLHLMEAWSEWTVYL
jgi:hypothetical protein